MLGDIAAQDADIYLEMVRNYPDQMLDIYIRKTRDTKNARRIQELIREAEEENITMIHS